MPDNDIEISQEEREQIVDIRFNQLLDKHWEKRFNDSFEKKAAEMTQQRRQRARQQQPDQPDPEPEPERKHTGRRRSFFEICMQDALGL